MNQTVSNEELAEVITPLDNLDKDRPYVMATDGTALQLHPMEEKALRDDMGDDANLAIFEELHKFQDQVEERIARRQADAAVPSQVRKSVPASGSNVATIEIHMRQVFMHLIGRRNVADKPDIIGLYGFGSNVNRLVQGYNKGCPYAAWYLWQVEQQILSLRNRVRDHALSAEDLISEANVGIRYEPFTSSRPTTETLSFHAIHAHQVSSILKQYDDLLRRLFPYLRNHFITQEQWNQHALKFGTQLRRLFLTPNSWFFVGKPACEAKDMTYLAATNKMGQLPNEFLTGEQKPAWVNTAS